MEKILVAMDANMTSVWSLVYALNLAKRMQVKISILLVSSPESAGEGKAQQTDGRFPIKAEVERLIAEGRAGGIAIDYYHASGSYKEEIIRFIREKKIGLLVLEKRIAENMSEFIEEIKLRTYCRIELVQPKNIHP